MRLSIEERSYLTLIHLAGRIGSEDRAKLWKSLDDVMRGDPLSIVWDLSGVEELQDPCLAVLAGSFAWQRLRNEPVVIMGVARELGERIRRTGVGYEAAMVSDEQEACLAILERTPRRYDEFFCKVLVQEGFVTPDAMKNALLQFERSGREGDFGKLLLQQGMVTAPQLLEAVCRQKSLLGDILVETGTLDRDTLEKALKAQSDMAKGEKLGDFLMRLGVASNQDIYEALARQYKRRKRFHKKSRAQVGEAPTQAQSARLGEILLEQKLLSQEDLERSLQLQRQTQGREKLGDILVRLGFVSDSDLYGALLTQYERTRGGEVQGAARAGVEALVTKLATQDHVVVRHAAEGLMALGGPALALVVAALRNASPAMRKAAADLLGDAMCFEAIPGLLERLEDPVPRVRHEAFWALVRITGQSIPVGDTAHWQDWWRATDPKKLPPPPENISTHREQMARLLAKGIQEGHALDPFDLEYRAGQEDWEGGHARLQLRGDGLVHVLHLKRGEARSWSGDLGSRETREILDGFAQAGILFVDTARTVDDPGESRHEMSLRIGNRFFRRSTLYYRELFQHWNFRSFESKLRDVLRRLTRGAVL